MLDRNRIRRFYINGFEETVAVRNWPRMWNKQFRIRTVDGAFIKLNRFRDRFSFKALKRYCIHHAPASLYMSVLNWMMPERVGEKSKANRAYPIGGEYVVDVDLHLFWRPHYHYVGLDGVCIRCLSISRDAALRVIDKVCENHSDIHIVFSGRKGFHVHVLDFDVRDWTHYDEGNPIKSHEVARFLYTRHVKRALGGFDDPHFKLSCDPMRMITFPGSLNSRSGLICTHLGGPSEFESMSMTDVLHRSRALHYFFDDGFRPLVHAHLEPHILARR